MAQLFHSLKTTVFHVTHDPSEAFAMADRIIVMNNGMIDQMDTPFACYLQPGTSMVAGLLGAGNCLMKALITSGSDEFCQVSLGGKKLTGLYFKPTGKAGTEDGTPVPFRAELRFRPEECGWQETEGENTIPVTVVMSTFEGGVYRIKVMTAEGEGFCLLHQDFLEEGKTGYACIAKERLYIYEKN
jgi:iron(III) transport system ATP-binding protein/putative spermidine/putrescine transport system ATP-binding protein